VKLDAPRVATNIWTGMISPVPALITSAVRPAKSTNSFSPATWTWRIVGFSRPAPPVEIAEPGIADAVGGAGAVLLP